MSNPVCPSEWFKTLTDIEYQEYHILAGVYHGLAIGGLKYHNSKIHLDLKKRGLIRYYESDRHYEARPTKNGKEYFDLMEGKHDQWARKYFPELYED